MNIAARSLSNSCFSPLFFFSVFFLPFSSLARVTIEDKLSVKIIERERVTIVCMTTRSSSYGLPRSDLFSSCIAIVAFSLYRYQSVPGIPNYALRDITCWYCGYNDSMKRKSLVWRRDQFATIRSCSCSLFSLCFHRTDVNDLQLYFEKDSMNESYQ